MSDMSDMFDHDFDSLDDEEWGKFRAGSTHKRCNLCLQGGLHWKRLGANWKLAEANGGIHNCAKPRFKPKPEAKPKTLNCYDELV